MGKHVLRYKIHLTICSIVRINEFNIRYVQTLTPTETRKTKQLPKYVLAWSMFTPN